MYLGLGLISTSMLSLPNQALDMLYFEDHLFEPYNMRRRVLQQLIKHWAEYYHTVKPRYGTRCHCHYLSLAPINFFSHYRYYNLLLFVICTAAISLM